MPVTLAIAHRGYHMQHPENTVEAFASAVALGADMVELDCRLTADGHVVVLHDRTLARMWGVAKPVKNVDWDEVAKIRRKGYRIPELAEVLRAIELPVMVDVPGVRVLEATLAVVVDARALERCMFAGHTGAMARLRQMSPSARLALSWAGASYQAAISWPAPSRNGSTPAGGWPRPAWWTTCTSPASGCRSGPSTAAGT